MNLTRKGRREHRQTELLLAQLRADAHQARQQAATAQQIADDWKGRCERLAGDRIKGASSDAREMARLNDIADGLAAEANTKQQRIERLTRGAARYRAENLALRRQLDRWEGGDRAVMSVPQPRSDADSQLARARQEIASRNELIYKLQDRLDSLQTANENSDWLGIKRDALRPAS